MKVIFPGRFLHRHVGGNSTYTQTLARLLSLRGWTVDEMPWSSNPVSTLLAEWRSAARIREGLLHFTGDTGPLTKPPVPTVVTIHGMASRWIPNVRSPMQERIWRERVARAAQCADHVITVSHSSATDIAAQFSINPSRITVIYHGIEPLAQRPPTTPPTERLVECRGCILYLGNLEPRKNIINLIEGYTALKRRNNVPPLVIAGRLAFNSGKIREFMSRASTELGDSLKILGFVSEPEKAWLLHNTSCFVFPSLYEGFGFPVLEALQAGVPVVTSTRGSLGEIAGPALTMSDPSPKSITEAIAEVMDGSVRVNRCLDEGPSWAATFRWDGAIDKHEAVYQAVSR